MYPTVHNNMGGIGWHAQVAPLEGVERKPLSDLHKPVWDVIEREMYKRIGRPAGLSVLNNYLHTHVYDAFADNEWDATEEHGLGFWFRDYAGLCGCSENASFHWSLVAFALRRTEIDARRSSGLAGQDQGQRAAALGEGSRHHLAVG